MTHKTHRNGTGDPEIDNAILQLLDKVGAHHNRDQLFAIFSAAAQLASDDVERLNLKITNAAIHEMMTAFHAFRPYVDVPKVTMFGSARTLPTDPLYAQAKVTAQLLAEHGWMVVTGAGPGIMAAGLEGAGLSHAFGINIRLPFEQSANPFIAEDTKLVTMKYFFTRKLMLIKESDGFIVLPGGFGTLDETFELLTLVQTGKAEPTPIVLLEVPGATYWQGLQTFIESVKERGLISADDDELFVVTDSAQTAADEVLGFYRNYHSRRFVGDHVVIRLQASPTDTELRSLNDEFGYLCVHGGITRCQAHAAEKRDNDQLDLPRISFLFDKRHHGGFRKLINALNALDSAPRGRPEARHYEPPQE